MFAFPIIIYEVGAAYYTRRQIKNDQPGSHDFRHLCVNSKPIPLTFCKGHFLFKS